MDIQTFLIFIILPLIVALLLSLWLYKPTRRFATKYGVVDKPDERRLNKTPIPVMGGVEIFIASLITFVLFSLIFEYAVSISILVLITLLLFVGILDDRSNIRWSVKFVIELLICLILIHFLSIRVSNFYGLFGVWGLPDWFSYLFSFMIYIGVINGVNLMDGINGLASGYGIMSLICFLVYFLITGVVNSSIVLVVAIVIGAIVPFWVYNVFSRKQKMFMGDSGSLILGLLLSILTIRAINMVPNNSYNGILSFVLAILAVPVFDTLRVMVARVISGSSPFTPDKRHLHHIFIDLGFTHILTSMVIILLNILVVLSWLVCYWCKVDINIQFIVVFVTGIVVTGGIYLCLSHIRRKKPKKWQQWQQHCQTADFGRSLIDKVSTVLDE